MMYIIAALALFPCLCLTHPVSSEKCSEPENFDTILAMHQAEDTLSIILPLPVQREVEILNRRAHSDAGVASDVYRGPEQLLYGNKTCPISMADSDNAPIEERSTCPYYYVISNDLFRYPVAIAEARCKCMYCFDDSTGDNLCEPVYFPKTILRRQKECLNGMYQYQPETYYVQNGCVCAKRRFVSTSTSGASGNDKNSQSQTRTTTRHEQSEDKNENGGANTGAEGKDDDKTSEETTIQTNWATTKYPFTFQ